MPASASRRRASGPEASAAVRARVWFALLGGGSAWMLHLLLAYAISEFGCLAGFGARHIGGLSAVAWLLLAASALALAIALGATLIARRIRRQALQPSRAATEGAQALAFGGQLAFVTNLVFSLVIAVQSVPIFYFLRSC